MYKAIIQFIQALKPTGDNLYFDLALTVPEAPHVRLWAAAVDGAGFIRVMDADHEWFTLEENDEKDAYIVEALYHRARYIHDREMAPAAKEGGL